MLQRIPHDDDDSMVAECSQYQGVPGTEFGRGHQAKPEALSCHCMLKSHKEGRREVFSFHYHTSSGQTVGAASGAGIVVFLLLSASIAHC